MDPIIQKFRNTFIEEAHSLLDNLEKDLLELEKTPHNNELIESAFRAMHTIKGVSGMYGFGYICDYTHHLESIYQSVRDKSVLFSKEIFDVTFESVDHIRKLLDDEHLSNENNKEVHEKLLVCVKRISSTTPEPIAKEPAPKENPKLCNWNIKLRTNEQQFFRGINMVAIFQDLAVLGEFEVSPLEKGINNEDCDLWNIQLSTQATENEIREVFIFIEDDCEFLKSCEPMDESIPETQSLNETNIIQSTELQIIDTPIIVTERVEIKTINAATQPENIIKRISVEASKLDNLMYLVSELISINSQLIISTKSANYEPIREIVEKVDNLSKLFRNNALEIRLVPLSDTVLRFQRLIRDLSKQLNKEVQFVTQGVDTELDKNTIDQLAEPLMHLIRNCIDHGIELPEIRKMRGKPDAGQLKLSAYNSGNQILIRIEDDGNGIDLEKIRNKAIDKGLIKPSDKLSNKELYDLIFLPGFSTAQSLTEVSGRGVGMDIVKNRIKALRGEIIVDSVFEKGTSFTIKLQQSLSIVDSLLFKVENTFFTIPIADIEVCDQIIANEIVQNKHTATIPYNEQLISFVDLRDKLKLSGRYSGNVKTVIVRYQDKLMAILTDKIIGEHQAVLKPLGKSVQHQQFLSSASQLGDGNMAFMIDTNTMLTELYQTH